MPTLRTVPLDAPPLTDVVPAPRMPAEDAALGRRQRPTDQYWSVFEACWCVAKAGVSSAARGAG
jgi:hypothetical protein